MSFTMIEQRWRTFRELKVLLKTINYPQQIKGGNYCSYKHMGYNINLNLF